MDILNLILCHLLGDYVLQNDFIANTKGKNIYHLFVHCALYCIPFIVLYRYDVKILYLFITHFFIDIAKAKYNFTSYFQDQVLHYIVLLFFFLML